MTVLGILKNGHGHAKALAAAQTIIPVKPTSAIMNVVAPL
jgi:hypothetical protein